MTLGEGGVGGGGTLDKLLGFPRRTDKQLIHTHIHTLDISELLINPTFPLTLILLLPKHNINSHIFQMIY